MVRLRGFLLSACRLVAGVAAGRGRGAPRTLGARLCDALELL